MNNTKASENKKQATASRGGADEEFQWRGSPAKASGSDGGDASPFNGQPIKVLVSVIGLDGHFTGAEIVSRFLMDAGMEVVYLGIYQTPEMIVSAAVQESVDVIGISSHASNYEQIGLLIDLMKKNGLKDVPVICGGSIPEKYADALIEKGVSKIFLPHSTSESIIDYITSIVKG